MGLNGSVAAVGLNDVFGFLEANAQTGALGIRQGDRSVAVLYFHDGNMYLPRGRELPRPTDTGVVSRAWLGLVREVRKATGRIKRADILERRGEVPVVRSEQEIQDLFLLDRARFEFEPGPLPLDVEERRLAGEGQTIPPKTLMMELARREDERLRIRQYVPGGRVIFRAKPGAEERVHTALNTIGVPPEAATFNAQTPLARVVSSWPVARYDAFACVAGLVEGGALEALPRKDVAQLVRLHLDSGALPAAGELISHLVEAGDNPDDPFALDYERQLLGAKAFLEGQEVECAVRLSGPRVFSLIFELVSGAAPVTLVLREDNRVARLAMLPGVIAFDTEGTSRLAPLEEYLAKLCKLSVDEVRRLRREKGTFRDAVPAKDLEAAILNKLVDEIADIVFWKRVDVELRNRGKAFAESSTALILPLAGGTQRRLRDLLEGWRGVFESVPGEDVVFVPGARTKGKADAGAKFFKRFGLLRNQAELARACGADRLQFAKVAAQGLRNDYLARPTADSLAHWVERARAQDNEILAYRLVRAGLAFGYGARFQRLLAEFRGKDLLPVPEPAFQGDLEGIGLPAILQILTDHRLSGTLVVSAGDREEDLYLDRGALFLLSKQDAQAEEFMAMLLGGEEDFGGAESLAESDVDEDQLERLKARALEVVFWEGATFSFLMNDLPQEFFVPSEKTTKVALQTQAFLIRVVQTMAEWDALEAELGGLDTVFRFQSAELKLKAIQEHDDDASLITLIDGQLTLAKLLRKTNSGRLKVGNTLANLLRAGMLEAV